jgi:fructosamine-3-kinase
MVFNNYEELVNSSAIVVEKLGRKGTKHLSHKIKYGEKYLVLKRFRSSEEAQKESKAYDIIGKNTGLLLPKKYFTDGEFLLYEFIKTSSQCTPLELIHDWQEIHSNKDLVCFFEVEKPNREHVDWLAEKVIERKDLYGLYRKKYAEIIKQGINELTNPPDLGVVHGDLRLDNVICNKNEIFYLDLESCGTKDPISDLVPTVLFHIDWKNSVIELYNKITGINKRDINRRLAVLSMFRGTKLIGFHNQRNIKEELKIKARKRVIRSLDSFLK